MGLAGAQPPHEARACLGDPVDRVEATTNPAISDESSGARCRAALA